MPATFGSRFIASSIDTLIDLVINYLLSWVVLNILGLQSPQTPSEWTTMTYWQIAIAVVVQFFYGGWFYKNKGGTPGKLVMGIRVVTFGDNDRLENLGYWHAFGRETLGKLVSASAFMLGFFAMLWHPKKLTWHDRLWNTAVVNSK